MKLSRTPDFSPWRRMLLLALAAGIVAMISSAANNAANLPYALGDTDDAMRVVMMRALAAGQGWFDQKITRLQPPLGVYMHWSRLIDGGLALLDRTFGLFTSPAKAELATRFLWPFLWIPPVVFAGLAVARRLGGPTAVFVCAIIMAVNLPLFLQFRPGRVDHHNVQIALCMLALAGAAIGRTRGAALAGIATGLGLAIGLEALAFEVLVGAWFPLRYLLGEEKETKELRTYAMALGAATAFFFLVQTPPWRWTVVACDAIGFNLTVGVAVACLGLLATVALTTRRDWRWRLGLLAVSGVLAAGAYVALDPNCLHGPFADVDPQLKVFWLPNVQEIRAVTRVWRTDHATVIGLLAPMAMGMIAWAWLYSREDLRKDGFIWLAGACLLAGSVTGWNAVRMAGYANWFAVPLIAAAAALLVDRYAKGAMLVATVAAFAVTPMFTASAATEVDKQIKALTAKPKPAAKPAPKLAAPKPAPKPAAKAAPRRVGDPCFQIAAYADLARQPAGLTLSEIDLGPFVLAHTPSSSMTAPYHRMNWGLIEARKVLSTKADDAEAGARKLGATYVLECARHARNADRVGMGPDSLQKQLDAGKPPAWLEPISVTGQLKVYRVRPSAPAPASPASAKE